MYQMIMEKVPSNWAFNQMNQNVSLDSYNEEYKQVEFEIKNAMDNQNHIIELKRVQDVYAYGQFLLRGQLMAFSSTDNYYRVRRFIKLSNVYQDIALRFNLDPRRCGLTSLRFTKKIGDVNHGSTVFVVQVITHDPHADTITPNNSGEYYIEYIARI